MGNCQSQGISPSFETTGSSSRLLDVNGATFSSKLSSGTRGSASISAIKKSNSSNTIISAIKDAYPTFAKKTAPPLPLANICMSPVEIDENYTYPKFEKSDRDRDFIRESIQGHFIFENIRKADREHLLDAFELHSPANGEEIITQGEIGDYFYIIRSGQVEFTIDGRSMGDAGTGKAFGDLAMIYDCPRTATCHVKQSPCNLWRVDQKSFRQILANGRVKGDQETIETLRRVSFLKDLLSNEYLTKMATVAKCKNFKASEFIIKKGDPGKYFYILRKGTVAVKNIGVGGQDKFTDKILKAGDFFGERAIMEDEPRSADITALEDCSTLCLSRQDFLRILGPFEKLLQKEADLRDIKSIPIFANSTDITACEYVDIVAHVEEVAVAAGTLLYNEDEEWEPTVYFVRKGSVLLTSKSESTSGEVTAGGYFGVDGIKVRNTPMASSKVMEDTILGVLKMSDIATMFGGSRRFSSEKAMPEQEEKKKLSHLVKFEELKKHRLIGIGTFGKVWLVSQKAQKNDLKKAYALKVQRKRQLLKQKQVEGAIREVKIMACLDHPFLLKLHNIYQDSKTIMFLLPLIQGGELTGILEMSETGMLPQSHTLFYAACILQGLQYMHCHQIVYRDLKPENVLIGNDGYPILVDFGFAKKLDSKTFTLCGTVWYIAPEVIMGSGHDKACDYWSWGVLTHLMETGTFPFGEDHDQMSLFKAITKGNFNFSRVISRSLGDLLRKILITEQQFRLGNLADGAEDIKNHEWLRLLNFNKLTSKLLAPPWRPGLIDPCDVSAFENWDYYKKDRREKKLTIAEQEEFLVFNNMLNLETN